MVNPRRAPANHRLSRRLGAAVEYALIIALVGGGLVGALAWLANSTKRLYTRTSAAPFLPNNPLASNGVATPPGSPPGDGGPGSTGAPPDSAGSGEPSDSAGTAPDSSGTTTGTQGGGGK
jgi:hypothetical protein